MTPLRLALGVLLSLSLLLSVSFLGGCGLFDDVQVVLHSGPIHSNVTWRDTHRVTDVVHVHGRVFVDSCSTVRLDPGTRLVVHRGARIIVSGRPGCPATFTSAHAGGFGPGRGRQVAMIWVLDGGRVQLSHVVFRHSARNVIYTESGAFVSRTGVRVHIIP